MSHWSDSAVCASIDPAIWSPIKGANGPAKRLCATCPVAAPCLKDALASVTPVQGVWGGTSERDRRLLRAAS